ncbi:MAG: hypothetical protein AABO57_08490 [Acidobacteriota bacterium]
MRKPTRVLILLLCCSALASAQTNKHSSTKADTPDQFNEDSLNLLLAPISDAEECRGKGASQGKIRFSTGDSAKTEIEPALLSVKTVISAQYLKDIDFSLVGGNSKSTLYLAPIRTTSPAVTVYRGGVIKPRYVFTSRELGGIKADIHALEMTMTYGPTPKIELETDLSFQRTSFSDGVNKGSDASLGNITLWGKYRFFRTMETWGHSHAAIRFGLGLPTTKKTLEKKLDADDFVRQQLTTNTGGISFNSDVSFSQAKNRFIYGANIQGIMRADRDGYRLGNEIRINTDFEFIILPLKYQNPGKEVYAILETNYVHRRRGRINGGEVPGSSSSEFYLAPALQYTATSQFVVEASLQLPVVDNSGPMVLRTRRSLLIGVRYLY